MSDLSDVPFNVFANRVIEKYLLATRCLLALTVLQSNHPSTHYQLIRLKYALANTSTPLNPKVLGVINTELSAAFPDLEPHHDLTKLNQEMLQKKDSVPHFIVGLQSRQFLEPKSRESNIKELVEMLQSEETGMDDAKSGLEVLREWGADEGKYLEAARTKWKDATVFQQRS